jgi:NADP-dependent 3-hydroxy acid dehydrogenase YdfG
MTVILSMAAHIVRYAERTSSMDPEVVVITGASSGIGAALAELLASRAHPVVLVARRQRVLEEVAARCGEHALVVAGDVSKRDQVKRAIAAALERFGRIDVWVNNAGIGITRPPSQLTDDDIDLMMQVNVKSAIYGMQEVLPHFVARGRGQIVNVSSMLGRLPFATFRSAYCGAKHFLNAVTATFRAELKDSHPGIVVSLVSPGVVRTDFGLNAIHGGPDSRQLPGSQSAEEVAAVIADVIATKSTDAYTSKGSRDRVVSYYASVGADPA